MMLGVEDTVIGEVGNAAARTYVEKHCGPKYLLEIKNGGHVSFTSCELYNANYGNGIGESKSLTKPGTSYQALPPPEQHEIANSYGLAFLNLYLRPKTHGGRDVSAYLKKNHFGDKIVYSA